MTRATGPILMVGSIPLPTPEEVFRACGKYVGPYVSCLPDGEVAPRTLWVGYLARYVYDGHPDVETVQRLPVEREWNRPERATKWNFRLKPGVGAPHFETGYADFALESYAVFKRVRDAGAIPAGVRFQVCFPSPGSAFLSYFEDVSDWPAMTEAYEDAYRRDMARILEAIPAGDLAIQIDYCTEIRDILDAFPWSPHRPGKFETWMDAVARQAAMVPDDALLGLHWCYGTLGGWPMIKLEDLAFCTRLTNAAVARIERRVDYVHMPVLRHAGDAYFAPLGALAPGDAKVYLGLLHHTDDLAANRARIATARKHLAADLAADLGAASVCGYGRLSVEDTRKAFELHAAIGAELAAGA
jgi:hypothetical protein